MRKRIAVLTHYLDGVGGGVTSVVMDVQLNLKASFDIKLFGLNGRKFKFVSPGDFKWGQLGYDSTLARSVLAWQPDLIHLHGLFTFVSRSAFRVASLANVPFIVSPHGMLDPWALNNSRLKKKLFFSLIERKVLNAASRIHVLNVAEEEALSKVVCAQSRVRVIPNGVSTPKFTSPSNAELRFKLLYLGRLHPKKGVSELLQSLYLLKRTRPILSSILEVSLVGWGEKVHVGDLNKLAHALGLSDLVHFRGPAFEEEKEGYFVNADAFILPSFSEGLPMAVLEAWSYGLPVLMTPECNLPEGFESQAAIRIENNPEGLAGSIAAMLEMPRDELREMGQRGLELVRRKFSWDSVAKQYMDMYDEVLAEHEAKKLSKHKV